MMALLRAELGKLRGSLALALALLAPALPGLIGMLGLLTSRRTLDWSSVFGALAIPTWAMFLMPLTVAAFATLAAQIEHQAGAWDHLLALPLRRWQLFAAKLAIILLAVTAMTVAMLVATWLGAAIAGAVTGRAPTGPLPWPRLARVVPMLLASTALIGVIQTWTALRWANFVVPLCVGIGGTMVTLTVAITRTDKADWFPWVLPLKVLTVADPVIFTGWVTAAVCGAAVLAIGHLSQVRFR